jgi:choline transport protein
MTMAEKKTDVDQNYPHIDEEGLSADEIQLRAQGHVGELPRQFSAFQTIAFSFQISNTWVG